MQSITFDFALPVHICLYLFSFSISSLSFCQTLLIILSLCSLPHMRLCFSSSSHSTFCSLFLSVHHIPPFSCSSYIPTYTSSFSASGLSMAHKTLVVTIITLDVVMVYNHIQYCISLAQGVQVKYWHPS